MLKIYNSEAARAQGDAAREVSSQPLAAHDLQARRLGQRFTLSPEMARAYAHVVFDAEVRS